jgi:hypothetical protein
MSEGFFSRWSRRKEAVREGKAVEAEPVEIPPAAPFAVTAPAAAPSAAAVAPMPEPAAPVAERPPAPTLEDVQSLTPGADFSRFVAPEVAPDVKNAALRKLFADPHFNRMDGLDVYIDDYGKPDPLPAAMARKLVGARFLKLFDDEEEEGRKDAGEGREVADDLPAQSVAQSAQAEPAVPRPPTDADPDLRLQQDHAPGPPGPGQGTG